MDCELHGRLRTTCQPSINLEPMRRPQRKDLYSFLTLASLLGATVGQQLRQVYPWGPETAWTRYNWPELKLRYLEGPSTYNTVEDKAQVQREIVPRESLRHT